MKKNLVLTGNLETFSDVKQNILLGSWCDQVSNFSSKKIKKEIKNYHWSDLQKIKDDHKYLYKLYNRSLICFTNFLNAHHNMNCPQRYWEIIIGSWLVNTICILFDRWENLKKIYDKDIYEKINILNFENNFIVPEDSNDFFLEKIKSHNWNHLIFFEIIKHLNSYAEFNFIDMKNKLVKKNYKENDSKLLRKIIDFILSLFPQKKKILFYKANFTSIYTKIFIYLKTGIVLREFFEFDFNIKKSNKRREKLVLKLDAKNEFEKFLCNFIISILPSSFLENFKQLRKKALKINFDPEIIFTTYGQFMDDFFKIWAAEKILQNKKLIVCTHGGSVEKEINFNMWNNISDMTICWNKITDNIQQQKNSIQMPPNFILKKKFFKKQKQLGKKLLFLTYEVELYAHRVQDGPIASNILKSFSFWKNTINLLNKGPLQDILIRHGQSFQDAWEIKKKFINLLGKDKFSEETKIETDFKKSKFVINTAMQTTFLETMKTGVPTIIILDNDLWNLSHGMKTLYNKLKINNVIFTDANLAAKHINRHWDNPLDWWNSKDLINLRNEFSAMCSLETKNNFAEWANFINNIDLKIKETSTNKETL